MPVQTVVVRDLFPAIVDALAEEARRLRRDFVETAYARSQTYVPVDTGALRESGHVEEDGDEARVVYDAVNTSGDGYAAYVEYGTRFTRAQPFLTPAFEDAYVMFQGEAANLLSSFE